MERTQGIDARIDELLGSHKETHQETLRRIKRCQDLVEVATPDTEQVREAHKAYLESKAREREILVEALLLASKEYKELMSIVVEKKEADLNDERSRKDLNRAFRTKMQPR